MKQKFSKNWKASKQPRKQRKYLANAAIHIKRKLLGANLSKDLRKKYGKRNIALKKGDKVKVLRGKFKGKTGKIIKIDIKMLRVFVEGMQIKKQDGSKIDVKIAPSNLQIIDLNTEDRKRKLTQNKEIKKEEKK